MIAATHNNDKWQSSEYLTLTSMLSLQALALNLAINLLHGFQHKLSFGWIYVAVIHARVQCRPLSCPALPPVKIVMTELIRIYLFIYCHLLPKSLTELIKSIIYIVTMNYSASVCCSQSPSVTQRYEEEKIIILI